MKVFARTGVIVLTIITVGLCAPAMADYQAGVDAYNKKDFKTALDEWLPLAEAGDATAQNAVGAIYDHGLGVEKDDVAAVHWYQLAADQNFPLAMRNLAMMYAGGHGVAFDKDQAEYWFQKAAEAGDPFAIKHMAAKSPTGTEFAAAPAEEPVTAAGSAEPAPAAPAPADTQQAAAVPEPAPAPVPAAPAAQATAEGGSATGSGEAPQYGDAGSAEASAGAVASANPTTSQQAALTPPPAVPGNWLIGMWQGPALGCPPGGGLEFAPGETRSYYNGQIAARLKARYEVTGKTVTVITTGIDGIDHSYQYDQTGPNTFEIAAVPADMPQSMIGIEHKRCASAPLAAAAAPAPTTTQAAAPAKTQTQAAAPAPAPAKPAAVAAAPAPAKTTTTKTMPAPSAVPVNPVTQASQPAPIAGASQVAAKAEPAAPGSPQAGWDAFGRGDYQGALAVWQPLAEQGNVSMQLLVGSIYDYGQGVPQDDTEAAKWYERAAMQGSAKGQYQLGSVYARSAQVKDPVKGYKWLTIAARTLANGPQDGITADQATTMRALIEGQMSKDDIAKAQAEADAFKAAKE